MDNELLREETIVRRDRANKKLLNELKSKKVHAYELLNLIAIFEEGLTSKDLD